MRILIIRHGDPDYEHDSLTEKGWREAALLADKLEKETLTKLYVSPLGRAKATASLTLERKQMEAEEQDWLQEFDARIIRPDSPDRTHIAWDWLPEDWTAIPEFYDSDRWTEPTVMQNAKVREEYQRVTAGLDTLLARHGYVRDGNLYLVEQRNRDTIALFCHFGVECVLLSHLMNVSALLQALSPPFTARNGGKAKPAFASAALAINPIFMQAGNQPPFRHVSVKPGTAQRNGMTNVETSQNLFFLL